MRIVFLTVAVIPVMIESVNPDRCGTGVPVPAHGVGVDAARGCLFVRRIGGECQQSLYLSPEVLTAAQAKLGVNLLPPLPQLPRGCLDLGAVEGEVVAAVDGDIVPTRRYSIESSALFCGFADHIDSAYYFRLETLNDPFVYYMYRHINNPGTDFGFDGNFIQEAKVRVCRILTAMRTSVNQWATTVPDDDHIAHGGVFGAPLDSDDDVDDDDEEEDDEDGTSHQSGGTGVLGRSVRRLRSAARRIGAAFRSTVMGAFIRPAGPHFSLGDDESMDDFSDDSRESDDDDLGEWESDLDSDDTHP